MDEMNRKEFILIIENPDKKMKELIENIEEVCKEKYIIHSCAGIEIFNIVVDIIELIILLAEYPIILKWIEDKTIIMKVDGFVTNGTVDKIIKNMKKSPRLLNDVKKAYENRTIELEGKIEYVIEFEEKLQTLLENKGEE